MTAIEVCQTAVLGGQLEQCDHCGHQRNAYNSSSDRHCPKCQSLARAQWLEDRQACLLRQKERCQLSVGEVNDLLTINVPEDVEWSAPVKDEASDQYWYLGIENGDGTPTYLAVQSKHGALCIFTDEDGWYVGQKNNEAVEDL
jgi:hypothetical protein